MRIFLCSALLVFGIGAVPNVTVNDGIIKLNWNLERKNLSRMWGYTLTVEELLNGWARRQDATEGKSWAFGSEEAVTGYIDKGLFASVLAAYSNHMILKTGPEDWWLTISQIVAKKINDHASEPEVREFFVSFEGKKELVVDVGPNFNGADSNDFLEKMTEKIAENINKPQYTDIMDMNFSGTTNLQKTVNNVQLLYSFKTYFDYTVALTCGIPGLIMKGSEADWKKLIKKHEQLELYLKPLEPVLNLESWFQSSRNVLKKLLATFQQRDEVDVDWWNRIVTEYPLGSGPTTYDGWLLKDFYGLSGRREMNDVPSGVNAVPLNIVDVRNGNQDEAAVVAGFFSYKFDNYTNPTTYGIVEPSHGWAMFLKKDSPFRPPK